MGQVAQHTQNKLAVLFGGASPEEDELPDDDEGEIAAAILALNEEEEAAASPSSSDESESEDEEEEEDDEEEDFAPVKSITPPLPLMALRTNCALCPMVYTVEKIRRTWRRQYGAWC